ncbi:kinase-like domain-containing protein [Rhizoctonia solani]|nr:kinase-like domain-containing protein [Rhizoctonia solani]
MSIDDVVDCLIRNNCKDITSNLDLKGCSSDVYIRGGSGVVHKGSLRDGKIVAIKCVEVSGDWGNWKLRKKSIKHTVQELYAWSKCDHPGILKFLGFAKFGGHILLISPWMKNGSLMHYIGEHSQPDRLELGVELASALTYLHSMGIVHGDIKVDNVVISDDGHVQLEDFGSAILLKYSSISFTETGFKGTLRFMAPELLTGKNEKPTFKSDVYAFGMTLFQIVSGKAPYADQSDHTVPYQILVEKNIPDRPNLSRVLASLAAENDLWCLLTWCWNHNPEERPAATEVEEALVEIKRFPLVSQEDKSATLYQPEKLAPSTARDIQRQGSHHYQQANSQGACSPPVNVNQSSSTAPAGALLNNPVGVGVQSSTSSTAASSSGPVPYLVGAAAGMVAGIAISSLSAPLQRLTGANPRGVQEAKIEHRPVSSRSKERKDDYIPPGGKALKPNSGQRQEALKPSGCMNNGIAADVISKWSSLASETRTNTCPEFTRPNQQQLVCVSGLTKSSPVPNKNVHNDFGRYVDSEPALIAPPIFTRIYYPNKSSACISQLNSWCDQIGIGRIQFVTNVVSLGYKNNPYHFQAIPVFPEIIDLGDKYMATGKSKQKAQEDSMSRILRKDGDFIARPRLVKYGKHSLLKKVVGLGASQAEAVEMAAEIILHSKHYCFF